MCRLVMLSTILTVRTLRTTGVVPVVPGCRLRASHSFICWKSPILKTLCRERRMDQGGEVAWHWLRGSRALRNHPCTSVQTSCLAASITVAHLGLRSPHRGPQQIL